MATIVCSEQMGHPKQQQQQRSDPQAEFITFHSSPPHSPPGDPGEMCPADTLKEAIESLDSFRFSLCPLDFDDDDDDEQEIFSEFAPPAIPFLPSLDIPSTTSLSLELEARTRSWEHFLWGQLSAAQTATTAGGAAQPPSSPPISPPGLTPGANNRLTKTSMVQQQLPAQPVAAPPPPPLQARAPRAFSNSQAGLLPIPSCGSKQRFVVDERMRHLGAHHHPLNLPPPPPPPYPAWHHSYSFSADRMNTVQPPLVAGNTFPQTRANGNAGPLMQTSASFPAATGKSVNVNIPPPPPAGSPRQRAPPPPPRTTSSSPDVKNQQGCSATTNQILGGAAAMRFNKAVGFGGSNEISRSSISELLQALRLHQESTPSFPLTSKEQVPQISRQSSSASLHSCTNSNPSAHHDVCCGLANGRTNSSLSTAATADGASPTVSIASSLASAFDDCSSHGDRNNNNNIRDPSSSKWSNNKILFRLGGPNPSSESSVSSSDTHEDKDEKSSESSGGVKFPLPLAWELASCGSEELRLLEEFLRAALSIPVDGDGNMTSLGSVHHHTGQCRPCHFQNSAKRPGGCRKGVACMFCHFPHESEEKQPRRPARPSKRNRHLLRLSQAVPKDSLSE